ncbi:MAG: AraC family transcriptional regulator, partial [Lentisphaerae bacterium]
MEQETIQLKMIQWAQLEIQFNWAYLGCPVTLTGFYHGIDPPVWLLYRGQLEIDYEDGLSDRFSAPCWVFPRAIPGQRQFSADTHALIINFRLAWPDHHHLFRRLSHYSQPANAFPLLEKYGLELARMAATHFPDARNRIPFALAPPLLYFQLQQKFYQWLTQYIQVMNALEIPYHLMAPIDPRLQRALDFIVRHPYHRPFPVEVCARHAGCSLSTLNRLFVQQFGKTPVQYYNWRRLEFARTLLSSSSLSIKALTSELGFSSPPHFSRWFKQQTGLTPT